MNSLYSSLPGLCARSFGFLLPNQFWRNLACLINGLTCNGYGRRDVRELSTKRDFTWKFYYSVQRDVTKERVDKTPVQTLACQLSSTLMQRLFPFNQDTRVKKTLIQTLHACQLSSKSCYRLTRTWELIKLLYKLLLVNSHATPGLVWTFSWNISLNICNTSSIMQILFSFDQDRRVEKTVRKTLACQFSSTLKQFCYRITRTCKLTRVEIPQTLINSSCRLR